MSKKEYRYLPPSYCSLDLKILLNEKGYDPYIAPFNQLYDNVIVPHDDVILWLYENFNIWVYAHIELDKWVVCADYINKHNVLIKEPIITNQSNKDNAYDLALIKIISEKL